MNNDEKKPNGEQLDGLLDFLRFSHGFDFTGYKRPSLTRRIQKRMEAVGARDYESYRDYLEVHPAEFIELFNTILINLTSFFRDPEAWQYLQAEALPRLLQRRGSVQQFRVWSAGCANGAEAYTIAMVLCEAMGTSDFREHVKIYGTDVDEPALAYARQGAYTPRELEPVPPELRAKYFVGPAEDGRFSFEPSLRRAMIFGRHDLLQDAPISRLDLLVCRNTLMYFNADVQDRILARFHYALQDWGLLFLGRAEMLLTQMSLFAPLEPGHRVFAKVPRPGGRERQPLPQPLGGQPSAVPRQVRFRDLALSTLRLGLLLVDSSGNLAFYNDMAADLFGLRPTDFSRPFSDLEVSYRPVELRSLIDRAYSERAPVHLQDITYTRLDGQVVHFEVDVVPLLDGEERLGASVAFYDQTTAHRLQEEVRHTSEQLSTAYEELQSANEELETTNEELQSTNEELETTNEELQSANEELETINEELQATNDELRATSEDSQNRSAELDQTNAFLRAILSGLRHAVVVVDAQLNVLAWNDWAQELWGLRPEEAQGQPFLGLDIGLPLEPLAAPLRACLTGKSSCEEVTLDARNRRGRAIRLQVICTPLRGAGAAEPDGVIMVMEEAPDAARAG